MKILKCTFLVLAMALCLFVPVQRGYAADQETTQVTEQSEAVSYTHLTLPTIA